MRTGLPLPRRIAIFAVLWLVAGTSCAVFSHISVEAGESEFFTRLQFVFLAPVLFAGGVAFTLVHSHYDTWQQRDLSQIVVWWLVMAAFVIHAIIALTRQTLRQFIALSVVQFLFLAVSISCVFHFLRYHATHGHG